MFAHLIHDGVEVLLSDAVFVFPAVLPLLLQVCQEFEHLRNTQTKIIFIFQLVSTRRFNVKQGHYSPHSC